MNIFEYLLIISPSEEIKLMVMNLKRIFANRYGCEKAAGLIPHITMSNWLHNGDRETQIISTIDRFAKTVHPFLAQFDGLGKFDPKTIFVNVFNREYFSEISKGLKNSTNYLLKNDAKFPSPAHLTIARDMKPEQFEQAWSEYGNEEFEAFCKVEGMVLLKRPFSKDGYKKYDVVAEFPFEGKKPRVEQLELGF
ncbi:2'-5' RNA ligase family protein [uncultured Algoriphagus sp.]|uniref:2'-5' RNA ligase family protein n=1 Tax=uncultured Algoriphagus sp. TaxID=417365 RepID=UPI0030EF2AD3|tara:strand:+ start:4003 stop:4584 length:582 start_codon:yes stop_codon:yes gene_type:complete